MQFLNEDFDYFVSERMQDNFNKLKKDKEYQETKEQFDKEYLALLKGFSPEQKKDLEKVLDTKYYLFSMEMCLAYKIGLLDGIKLDKSVK